MIVGGAADQRDITRHGVWSSRYGARALEFESMPAYGKITAIDSEIGALIRKRRVASGLTLQALAAALGCTYQQLSKYEKGMDRVSAARLLQIAETLQKPVASFYPEKRIR